MNANPQFLATTAHVDEAAVKPLPNSRKFYVQGSRPDIRVPMREITLTDTHLNNGVEKNPPIYVYDCSGPYTDPAAKIDIRSGLAEMRAPWIAERDDTEAAGAAHFRIWPATPARSGIGRHALQPHAYAAQGQAGQERDADALRAAGHHHAGDGIHRHPREPEDRRAFRDAAEPASGRELRRGHAQEDHAGIRARRSRRAAAPSSPPTSTIPKSSR